MKQNKTGWPLQPNILEIPAWTWLRAKTGKRDNLSLGDVPEGVWRQGTEGFDAVWLMGVWERSPAGRELALRIPDLVAEYRRVLADYTDADVVGSPYAVHAYAVDARLGGAQGLRECRRQLARLGKKLILDYVPNHVAMDHAWTVEAPEALIRGTAADRKASPGEFFTAGRRVYAHGRDPYFPPWSDTAQSNAFSPEARRLAITTLKSIASLCDGVRCDMAMLLLTDVFTRTWGERAGEAPGREFWAEIIGAVKAEFPDFLFLAEAYWDREWDLMQLGFDYCYDKRLYDRLVHDDAESVRQHLGAAVAYQRKLVRFLENHDEPRARDVLGDDKERAAAVLVQTLPGAYLEFAGQRQGARFKVPVHLGRAPAEAPAPDLEAFYRRCFRAWPRRTVEGGEWCLCGTGVFSQERNPLIAHRWQSKSGQWLVVVNYGGAPARGKVDVSWLAEGPPRWTFRDLLGGMRFVYPRANLKTYGLYVELPGWGYHVFQVGPEA